MSGMEDQWRDSDFYSERGGNTPASFKWRNMINFMFSCHYSCSCVEGRLYGPTGGKRD